MSHFDRGNAKIYDLTEPKSQEQRDQLNNFVRIVNRQAIPIFCFYETHKSDLVRIIRASPFKKVSCHGKELWRVIGLRFDCILTVKYRK